MGSTVIPSTSRGISRRTVGSDVASLSAGITTASFLGCDAR